MKIRLLLLGLVVVWGTSVACGKKAAPIPRDQVMQKQASKNTLSTSITSTTTAEDKK